MMAMMVGHWQQSGARTDVGGNTVSIISKTRWDTSVISKGAGTEVHQKAKETCYEG